jgi:ABC-2 family transporter protein
MTGFARTLRSEWTKLRTVPAWAAGLLAAAGLIVVVGVLPGLRGSCGTNGPGSACTLPVGPGGEEVTDAVTLVHRPLSGDGSVTVRVSDLTGQVFGMPRTRPVPWAKAGLIIRAGTAGGSSYAAVMLTGDHGVRLQHDYTADLAGGGGGGPRWLRLTRTGGTVTADESPDGRRWTTVGTVRPARLPATVEAGLFVTSPQFSREVHHGPYAGDESGPSMATATFDHLTTRGDWGGADWRSERPGGAAEGRPPVPDVQRDGDTFRVAGSGDLAPAVPGAAGLGVSLTQTLAGTFLALIVVVVLGAVPATAEYRRGLVRTTLAAGPRRVRVLAAKVVVVGTAVFAGGLPAAAVVVTVGRRVLRSRGVYVHPVPLPTEVRIVVGTAALLAVAAVLGLGLGTLLRRGVDAITVAVVGVVLPYVLAISVLPSAAGDWVLRTTPAAAFAVQQAAREYPQVANVYTPNEGYFPLAPWAGFAVLVGWAALVLAAAAVTLCRRDA